MADIDEHPVSPPSKPKSLVVWAVVAACAVWIGLLFVYARQSDMTLGRIFAGVFAVHAVICLACIWAWNPIVIERRMVCRLGTKSWDWVWLGFFFPTFVAVVVMAVRDVNMRETDPYTPGTIWLIGVAFLVLGWTMLTFAMVANPFFEKTVRIQTDHGHYVIDKGPYSLIRHPGYVGFSSLLISAPLMLGSAWTLLPVAIAVALFVIRTALEDRTLQAELPGYREYAERVRFRLIPGVW